MLKLPFFAFAVAVFTCTINPVVAQDAESTELKIETIVEGLKEPVAMTIRPTDNAIFISESGADRIVKVVDKELVEVISGFNSEGEDQVETPTCLEFANPNWLVVGGGADAVDIVLRAFDVSKASKDTPLNAGTADSTLKLANDGKVVPGTIRSMTMGSNAVLVASQSGENTVLAKVDGGPAKPVGLSRINIEMSDTEHHSFQNISKITLSKPEQYVAMIEDNEIGAVLTFCTEEGVAENHFHTDLTQITALAYSPKQGRLLLADRERGAIMELFESKDGAGCESKEVVKLNGIVAMRFAANGDLYAIVADQDDGSGSLVKVIGLDEEIAKDKGDK